MIHLMVSLTDCNPELLDDELFVHDTLVETTNRCNATLLQVHTHKFEPQGVTGFAMLAESHISIHTWPEKSFATADIFTCGDHNTPRDGIEFLVEAFQAQGDLRQEVARAEPVEAFDGIVRGVPQFD